MKQLEKEYPVVLRQDVIWGDMDAFGHINNTVYFRYFEDGRIAYLKKVGINVQQEQLDFGPILARAHCNFRLPLDYPDQITIATRCRILSPRKFNMESVVFSERHGAISAEGESLVVYYDYSNKTSCEIPAEVVTAIEAMES